jgi:hypothetical protein
VWKNEGLMSKHARLLFLSSSISIHRKNRKLTLCLIRVFYSLLNVKYFWEKLCLNTFVTEVQLLLVAIFVGACLYVNFNDLMKTRPISVDLVNDRKSNKSGVKKVMNSVDARDHVTAARNVLLLLAS